MADQISVVGTVILMMIVDFKKMAVEFKKFFGLSIHYYLSSAIPRRLCGLFRRKKSDFSTRFCN